MNMQKKSLSLYCATLGFIGYLPAPGTMATLATMPFMYLLHTMFSCWVYILIVVLACLVSIPVIYRALEYFKEDQDPSQIVLDEFLGTLVTFACVPLYWHAMLTGFFLFRFFDITKWFGIKYAERLIGAWGVVFDDILAALFSNVLLHLIYYFVMGLL